MAARASRSAALPLVGILALALATPASAGALLAVHASSSAAHQALMNATVTLDAAPADGTPEFEGETNLFGMVELKDLPPGAYTMKVEHPAHEPHEDVVVVVASETLHRDVELTPLDIATFLDVHVHVGCVKSQIPLPASRVQILRWENQGDIGGPPEQLVAKFTNADGNVVFPGFEPGFFEIIASHDGWEPLSFPDGGGGAFFGSDRAADARLKPVPTTLKVTVTGENVYSPSPDPGKPLKGAIVEITGLALDGDDEVVPVRSGLTAQDGTVKFEDLLPIRWKIVVKRFGFETAERIVSPDNTGNFADEVMPVELSYAALYARLSSPYASAVLAGGNIRLEGIANSETEGITRDMPADAFGTALFDRLLPGLYWMSVTHDAQVGGLPATSGPIPGPTALQLAFRPADAFFTAVVNQTTFADVALDPVPAVVHVRVLKSDSLAEPRADYPHDVRNLAVVPRQPVHFVEHAGVDLLGAADSDRSFDTDDSGAFTAVLLPGRYGLTMPAMSGYTGHDVTLEGQERGWPYPVVWPWPAFQFAHHAAWIHFESGREYQLELKVHRNYVNLVATYQDHPAENPCANLVVAQVGASTYHARGNDLAAGGQGQVTGPVARAPAFEASPVGHSTVVATDLPAGTYTFSGTHPRYGFEPQVVTVAPFAPTPGVAPPVSPASPDFRFPGVTEHAPGVTEAHYQSPGPITYHMHRYTKVSEDPDRYAYVDAGTEYGANYYQVDYLPGALCGYTTVPGAPAGSYTAYKYVEGQWHVAGGNGAAEFDVFYGGGAVNGDNVVTSGPPFPMSYPLRIHAVMTGMRSRNVPDVLVRFLDGSTESSGPTGDTTVIHAGSFQVTSAEAGPWTLESATPTIVSANPPRIELEIRMRRAMQVSGTVRARGQGIAGIRVNVRNRFGTVLGSAETGPSGAFLYSAGLTPQRVFIDIDEPGFLPVRLLQDPTASSPDAAFGIVHLEPLPPPILDAFTLDRHGIFLPGVSKSGDTSAFDASNAEPRLTMTWKVRSPDTRLDYTLPGFDTNDARGPDEVYSVPDPVAEVWIMDRRAFDGPSLNDPTQTPDPVPPPCPTLAGCDWTSTEWLLPEVRVLLRQVERGRQGSLKFQVLHQMVRKRDPDGGFSGKLKLWDMPSGIFDPVAVVITARGGVGVFPLPPQQSGGRTLAKLQGLRMPRWSSKVLDILGYVSNAPDIKPTNLVAKGRFVPYPKFNSAIDVDGKGYLTYDYRMSVDWTEGAGAPQQGALSFGPKNLGIGFKGNLGGLESAGLRFRVRGEKQEISLAVNASVTGNPAYFIDVLGPAVAVGIDLKDPKVKASGRLDIAEPVTDDYFMLNTVPDFRLTSQVAASAEVEFRYDLKPYLSRLAAMAPGPGPILAAALQSGAVVIELAAPLKVQGRISQTEETYFPVIASTISAGQPPLAHVLGGVAQSRPPVRAFDLSILFGLGINASAFRDSLSAQARVQIGPPANTLLDGLQLDIGSANERWPVIKRVQGALSFVATISVNFGVQLKGQYQLDLFPLDWQLGTVGTFDVRDLHSATYTTGPFNATRARFQPADAALFTGFYPPGDIDAAGEPPVLLLTDVDDVTRRIEVRSTRLDGDQWTAPVEIGEAGAVLGLAITSVQDGWLATWSEIDPASVGSMFPSSRLMYATSADGATWSEPRQLRAFEDAACALQLASADGHAVLAYVRTSSGPTSSRASLFVATWDGASWTEPVALVQDGEVGTFTLAGNGAAAASPSAVVAYVMGGDLLARTWSGGAWGSPETVGEGATGTLASTYSADGRPVVAWSRDDGALVLSVRDGSGWHDLGTPLMGALPSHLRMRSVTYQGRQAYLLAWANGGDRTDLRTAIVLEDGSLLQAPQSVTTCSPGTYSDVHITATDGLDARLIALLAAADETDVVQVGSSRGAPVPGDSDGDGVGDDCDNCPDVPNPLQFDLDQDGTGDDCDECASTGDADTDGDGACERTDNCPGVANATQADEDGDLRGDACDPCPLDAQDDSDGDLICDSLDGCPDVADEDQPDADADGVDDACDACPGDTDVDGDGICSLQDDCPNVADPSQLDADADGLGDACDRDVVMTLGTGSASEDDESVSVPVTFTLGTHCTTRYAARIGYDGTWLVPVSASGAPSGCTLAFAPAGTNLADVTLTCSPGITGTRTGALLTFGLRPPGDAQATLPLPCVAWSSQPCAEGAGAATQCDGGAILLGCVPGDLFPDGAGDGRVTLADFVIGRRKVLGSVPKLARDSICGDLHPGRVACDRPTGADDWCRAGDGDLDLGDVVVLRRLVSRAYQLGCAACAASVARDAAPLLPGDVTGDGVVDVTDAVRVLRWSVGLDAPSQDARLRGDASPAVPEDGMQVRAGDGELRIDDAVLVLRAAVGLERLAWPRHELRVRLGSGRGAVAAAVTVSGWPASAVPDEAHAACVSGEAALDGWTLTCTTDPDTLAPGALGTLSYRAPEAVDAATLSATVELLDASLVAMDGEASVASP